MWVPTHATDLIYQMIATGYAAVSSTPTVMLDVGKAVAGGLEHQGRQALELASPSKVWEKVDQKTLLKVGGCAAATVAGLTVPPLLLSSLGFGFAGVVAGSYAAWTNSVLPCLVVKGGLYATMQSWGAAGIPLASKLLIATCSGAAGLKTTALLTKDKDPVTCEACGGSGRPE
uniref:Putative interferon alpha-inducible protein n=1 Tax=Ixodes ricinus TaxID=34613 RepID=V5I019_IXORI